MNLKWYAETNVLPQIYFYFSLLFCFSSFVSSQFPQSFWESVIIWASMAEGMPYIPGPSSGLILVLSRLYQIKIGLESQFHDGSPETI